MINKLYNGLKKYILVIIIALIVILIGFIGMILFFGNSNKITIKEFKNNYCSFNYDNSWKIQEQKENSILLANKQSSLNIEVVSLENEYKYLSIEDMLDEFLFSINQQNQQYNLLFKEKDYITENSYEGYKILYEDGESQSMIMICKKEDKLFVFNYEAKNKYFDILLDSVQNIIYTFNTIDEKFELTHKLDIETSKIEWFPNEEITSQLNDVNNYDIANKNYLVNISVPQKFELSKFDSTYAYFNYKGLKEGSIRINADIYNSNIYTFLDKEEYASFYKTYRIQREDEEYSNFKEELEQIEVADKKQYIYKNSYTYISDYGNTDYEEVVKLYELDTKHVLKINIQASNTKIPKELVDSINLNSSKNYSSYIINKVEDGKLICELKEFVDYKKDKIRMITLQIPQKYKEVNDGFNNIYTTRDFSLNYDEKMEMYQYDITYDMRSSLESTIKSLNSSYKSYDAYGTYKELAYKQTIELNGKSFDIYEGGYSNLGGALFSATGRTLYFVNTKVLFYKLDSEKVLAIEIKGNGYEISDEMLNELTNFKVEIKNK